MRKATGGTHLWEGALVGTGVGVLAYGIASVPLRVEWMGGAAVLASVTELPGAVLGGLVGAGFPKYAWVAAPRPASVAAVSVDIPRPSGRFDPPQRPSSVRSVAVCTPVGECRRRAGRDDFPSRTMHVSGKEEVGGWEAPVGG